jgi:hypothetical protein
MRVSRMRPVPEYQKSEIPCFDPVAGNIQLEAAIKSGLIPERAGKSGSLPLTVGPRPPQFLKSHPVSHRGFKFLPPPAAGGGPHPVPRAGRYDGYSDE